MYRVLKKVYLFILAVIFAISFAFFVVWLFRDQSFLYFAIISGISFLIVSYVFVLLRRAIYKALYKKYVLSGFNQRIFNFYDKIKVSFSINDFVNITHDILEDEADFSVLWLNTKNNSSIYNTLSSTITSNSANIKILMEKYTDLDEGIYYMDKDFVLTEYNKNPKSVVFSISGYLLFIFSHYLSVFDRHLFKNVHEEFHAYLMRVDMIEKMFSLSAISKEWALLAETQQSFLPTTLPEIKGLNAHVFYEAFGNVGGDFYDIIKISENKTLFLMGDVSGKGLSAALIMGVIVNTIKIIENKEDLLSIITGVDSAVKTMGFDGKFTALFTGLFDTQTKKMEYINSGIPEPWVVSDGVFKILSTNCPLLGIIDLGEVQSDTIQLKNGDLILLSTDGVTEVENDQGEMLGDSQKFRDVVLKHVKETPQEIADFIIDVVKHFNKHGKLRDDIALMAIKVEE